MATVMNPFNLEHPDYKDQVSAWSKMEDLYMGSASVKGKGQEYLYATATEEAEMQKAGVGTQKSTTYSRRMKWSVFFNGVSRLTRYAMGHVFRVPPKFEGDELPRFDEISRDCDLMGTPLASFIRAEADRSYVMGHCLVMVDFPNMSGVDSRSVQKVVNPRPFLVLVDPREIINWSISRSLDGTYEFDWVVHRYSLWESDGPGESHALVVYYKVWKKNGWELWKVVAQSERDDLNKLNPVLHSEGNNPLGQVPYVTFYSNFIRPMVSLPPLTEAADININHYNVFSTFLQGLRHHLNPLFVTIGTQDTVVKRDADSGLALPRNGDAKYVETTGNGLKIGLDASDRIATEMWEAGMRSSAAVGANTSAEARKLSRSDFFSFLTAMVGQQQSSWARVFKLMALWMRADYTNERPIKLNDDFDSEQLEANQAEFLLNARKAGEMSKRLFVEEMKRGGVYRQDLDTEKELSEAKKDLESDLEALAKAEKLSNPDPEGTGNPPQPSEEPTSEIPSAAGG